MLINHIIMCNKDRLNKRLIYLDSVKRSSGSIEDLVFDIHPQVERVEGYEILDFDFTKNPIYNINAKCNLFTWEDTLGATINSVIPIQSYSPTQLASEMTSIMNTEQTGLAVYTMTYDNQTDKFTIDVDGVLTFDLITTDTTNSVYSKLGYDTTSDHTGSLFYTAEDISNIDELMYMYLKSRNITNILIDAPRNVGLLANSIHRVKAELTKNKIQFPVFINCNGQRISEIDIKLVDLFGEDVDLNGVNYSLTIMVYYTDMKINMIDRII